MRKLLLVLLLAGCSVGSDYSTSIYYFITNEEPQVEVPVETPVEVPEELPVEVEVPICTTKLVNFPNPLTVEDQQALATAKERCKFYYPDAPCLKKLIKKKKQIYHAICGVVHE